MLVSWLSWRRKPFFFPPHSECNEDESVLKRLRQYATALWQRGSYLICKGHGSAAFISASVPQLRSTAWVTSHIKASSTSFKRHLKIHIGGSANRKFARTTMRWPRGCRGQHLRPSAAWGGGTASPRLGHAAGVGHPRVWSGAPCILSSDRLMWNIRTAWELGIISLSAAQF